MPKKGAISEERRKVMKQYGMSDAELDAMDEEGPTKVDVDLWEVLGVEKGTPPEQLKKVYRKLALKYHPDKNPDQTEEAKDQFQQIAQAYKTLSDPYKLQYYNETGSVEDIDMEADSYMSAFVEMVDEMVGGVPIKQFFSETMGLHEMDPEDFEHMPPFPFPGELFPVGTFPKGLKTTREILTGLPPSVLELI